MTDVCVRTTVERFPASGNGDFENFVEVFVVKMSWLEHRLEVGEVECVWVNAVSIVVAIIGSVFWPVICKIRILAEKVLPFQIFEEIASSSTVGIGKSAHFACVFEVLNLSIIS